jgi:hypothetical protein
VKKKNWVGLKFGRWTVIEEVEPRHALCECLCEAKTRKVVLRSNLVRGLSTSCGCYSKEATSIRRKKFNSYNLSGEYGIGYTTDGREFYFDLEDYDKIKDYCWHIDKYGYVVTFIKRHQVKMHRYLLGVDDSTVLCDHRFGIRHDNRREYIRIATPTENAQNRGLQSNNTSGISGVWYDKSRNKWSAEIMTPAGKIYLGRYDHIEDAITSRREAEVKYFGEFRRE